ncbi:helix-turn-helix transcriptional regulator [Rhizobium sullae]|uniref:helix-turn-helix transcriptional regulator n=1 Tax=Rhizobium sullae TaxID=50338 RepID=UPI001FCD0F49
MSHAEIARQAGVSRQTIWRLANGEGRAPLWRTIARIEAVHRKIVAASETG